MEALVRPKYTNKGIVSIDITLIPDPLVEGEEMDIREFLAILKEKKEFFISSFSSIIKVDRVALDY